MAKVVQRRRGSTAEHSAFTGALAETTIDTTKNTVVVHDGTTVGGHPLALESLVNTHTSDLPTLTGSNTEATDTFLVYDASAGVMKSITREELNNAMEQDALANVDITSGTINGITELSVIGNITESTDGGTTYYNVVTQQDIGTEPNEIPLNQYLGSLAYQNQESVVVTDLRVDGDLTVIGSQTLAGDIGLGDEVSDTVTLNGTMNVPGENPNSVLYLDANKNLATTSTFVYDESTGNVGIGTSNPTFALDVVDGTSYQTVKLNTSTTLNSAQRVGIHSRNYAGSFSIGMLALADTVGTSASLFIGGSGGATSPTLITFEIASTYGTAGSERMRIDSAGNVGIGTSSPGAKLTINGGNARIYTGTTDGTTGFELFDNVSGGNHIGSFTRRNNGIGISSYDYLSFWTNATSGISGGSERMRIDSAGNLGIGTKDPNNKLDIQGTAFNPDNSGVSSGNIVLSGNTVGLNGYGGGIAFKMSFSNNGASGISAVQTGNDSDQVGLSFFVHPNTFGNNPSSEVMRLDASGNLGIGTTAPASKLQVEDVGIDTTTTTITTTSQTTICSYSATSFRTAELICQIVDTTNSHYHSVKFFVIHDGTNVWFSQTNVIHSHDELGTFTADISGGNVRLLFTPTVATNKTVKVVATTVTV